MERPERVAALRHQLEAVVDLTSTAALSADNTLRDDPEMNRLLEELGYLEKDDPKPLQEDEGGERRSPPVCSD